MNRQQKKKLGLTLLAVLLVIAAGWLLLNQYGLDMPEVDLPALTSQVQHTLTPASSESQVWSQAAAEAAPPEETASGLGELQVYFLDVGQGDSQLIRVPDGDSTWNMLIDTGEYAYADGLTDTLKALGVERIDALVNTHPHTDHMGCMARIVQRFNIGAVYMPKIPDDQVPTTSAYEALLRQIDKKGLTAVPLAEGTVIDCPDSLTLEVLAPDPSAIWDGLNNYSGVIRLSWADTTFLFTGDAEKQSEQVMLYSGADLSADVLKVGHHGSSTSTSKGFLEAVNPSYAVISCGTDNPYGHPHREVRQILEEHAIPIYRTDQDQTILFTGDGETLTIRTGLPSVAEKQW